MRLAAASGAFLLRLCGVLTASGRAAFADMQEQRSDAKDAERVVELSRKKPVGSIGRPCASDDLRHEDGTGDLRSAVSAGSETRAKAGRCDRLLEPSGVVRLASRTGNSLYTSQIRPASASEVSGSRFGVNSWPT